MCGIVGYTGKKSRAVDIVLDGLSALEYRGYDSAGIALLDKGTIVIDKQIGRVQTLRDSLGDSHQSRCAIGHTRWATHGGVTRANAHPHYNADKTIAVVHNGIIENYVELRNHLEKKRLRVCQSNRYRGYTSPHRLLSQEKRYFSVSIRGSIKSVTRRLRISGHHNRRT